MKYLGILNLWNLGLIFFLMVVMVFIDGLMRKCSFIEWNGSVEVVMYVFCLGI